MKKKDPPYTGDINKLINELIIVSEEYKKITLGLKESFNKDVINRPHNSKYDVLSRNYFRCLNLFQSSIVLVKSGFANEAKILIRCLFELDVNMYYLFNAENDSLINRYLDFNNRVPHSITAFNFYKKFIKEQGIELNIDDQDTLSRIKNIDDYKNDYGSIVSWHGKPFHHIYNKTFLPKEFYKIYDWYCSYVHGDGNILMRYLNENEGGYSNKTTDYDAFEALFFANVSYLLYVFVLFSEFKLSRDMFYDSYLIKLNNIINKYNITLLKSWINFSEEYTTVK